MPSMSPMRPRPDPDSQPQAIAAGGAGRPVKLMLLVWVILLAGLSVYQMRPPEPQMDLLVEHQFSAARALQHLEQLAQEPRPTGSAANAEARAYLVQQLEDLGLETTVQSSKLPLEHHNVIGVLRGTGDGEKALMFSAHYDSVPEGPGANDNGAAVAALLETAHILRTEPPLKNDIWFVFTDAEELGLIGAERFWSNPGYRSRIGMTVNLESRGSKGPSLMFQTSPNNGALIHSFGQSVPHIVANSFMGDLYRRLPNDTDFSVALRVGVPGLNFAYIEGWETYHSAQDQVSRVSLASLQHHGENALYAARAFGSLNLQRLQAPDRVYFSFLGQLIHYPQDYIKPASVVLLLLCAAIIIGATRRRLLQLKNLLLGLALVIGALVLAGCAAYALHTFIFHFWASEATLPNGYTPFSERYSLGYYLLGALSYALFQVWFPAPFKRHLEMLLVSVILYNLLLIVSIYLLPGASYLFMGPAIVLTLPLIVSLMTTRTHPDRWLSHPAVWFGITVLPVCLFVPIMWLLVTGLPPAANLVGVGLMVLLLVVLQPVSYRLLSPNRTSIPILATAVFLLVVSGWFLTVK